MVVQCVSGAGQRYSQTIGTYNDGEDHALLYSTIIPSLLAATTKLQGVNV